MFYLALRVIFNTFAAQCVSVHVCVRVFVRVALTCMRLTEQPGGAGSHHAVLGGVEDGLRQRDGVTHHGAVQAVLRHDAAAAPTLLPLSPLGSSVLKPNLEKKTLNINIIKY